MTDSEIRRDLIRRLNRVINRLPNGLLHRLLADAEFFEAWNLKKKWARGSSRMTQHRAVVARLEENYWKKVKQQAGGSL